MSNAITLKPDKVWITLNCQQREIKYDLNAYAELEKRYGSVESALGTLQTGSVAGLRVLLWAGIIHNEAVIDELTGEIIKYNVTLHDVGSWIEPHQIKEISLKITDAIIATLPPEEKAAARKEVEKALKEEALDATPETLEKKD